MPRGKPYPRCWIYDPTYTYVILVLRSASSSWMKCTTIVQENCMWWPWYIQCNANLGTFAFPASINFQFSWMQYNIHNSLHTSQCTPLPLAPMHRTDHAGRSLFIQKQVLNPIKWNYIHFHLWNAVWSRASETPWTMGSLSSTTVAEIHLSWFRWICKYLQYRIRVVKRTENEGSLTSGAHFASGMSPQPWKNTSSSPQVSIFLFCLRFFLRIKQIW